MLNAPWINPQSFDWTDSPNPVANPGLRLNNNPYAYYALQDQFMHALRNALGIEPRIYLGFDPNNPTLQSGTTQDYEVATEPNFWCYALSVSGETEVLRSLGEDFLFNVTDSVSGTTFFSTPASFLAMSTLTTGRGPLYFLSTPHLFAAPAYPIVRIINNSTVALTCRVTLYGCVETGTAP
jgi:hypothetical protein